MTIEWRTDNPPDKNAQYLVTYESGSLDICYWSNAGFGGNRTTDYHWIAAQYAKVKAWMPLPKPYSDPVDKIAQYIEDNCDKFSDELYNGLWDVIRALEVEHDD